MRRLSLVLCFTLALLTWSRPALAAVGSLPVEVITVPGSVAYLPLDLETTATVSGVNGQLNYDPSYFTNPTIEISNGANGFIGLGNVVTPGQFRFVIYANPTGVMQPWNAIASIKLETTAALPVGTTTLTYTLEAASDPNGVSLAGVDFSPAKVVRLAVKNAADNWAVYN